ncbi:trigger factor [Rhodopirellula sp. MGV]|uniref:trigger factor n=1 Tax=Rhodopirellula sp. MGV TaxID=2023130 RepID=UPI000B97C8CD|nr:trigger factor [Rhodopirellula sp. MGV]OYP29912.1 trigger factor [Rhodopirellula sp. MGV]PNY33793.1 trigger factor [Rhodopirellula baltica]
MSTSIDTPETAESPQLQLDVQVNTTQACVREVVVTIPSAEVQRYLKEAYDELVPEAQVPGFRSGRAPRRLVEKQFKDRVVEQVKGKLLMDSLTQVTDSESFSAISEPDFDYNSIPEPGDGDFTYQFTIEVRPDFDTPEWKGLELKKPTENIDEEAITEALDRVLRDRANWEATEEPAAAGDRVVVNIVFTEGGKTVSKLEEELVTVADKLSFTDGLCSEFGKDVIGKKEGDKVTTKVELSNTEDDEEKRELSAEVTLVEVQKLESVELTSELLDELGDFESEEELRGFIKESLERQSEYRIQQHIRREVSNLLSDAVNFELPEDLVRRQTYREIQRRILELQRSGFDQTQIRGIANALQQNARASTESALREHFVLEQIAEEEKIDATPEDFEAEIMLISQQNGVNPRKTRSRLEKSGQMDALRNQIVERKVIDMIVENAKVTEEDMSGEMDDSNGQSYPVEFSILGTRNDAAIPEAKYEDNSVPEANSDKDKE